MIIDAHLDLAYNVFRGRDVTRPAAEQPIVHDEIATVGLPDLKAGGIALICATLFAVPGHYNPRGYHDAEGARAGALSQLHWYRHQQSLGNIRIVTRRDELPPAPLAPVLRGEGPGVRGSSISNLKSQITAAPSPQPSPSSTVAREQSPAPLPIILLMEGADPLRTPDDLPEWFAAGLRIVGLAWERTRFAGGTGHPGPLTPAGIDLVRALDRHRIIHDTSHLSDDSFWQLLDLATGPVIASHSNCRAIVPGDRHLTDSMIRALAKRSAVIGLNFYDKFLIPEEVQQSRRVTLADLIAHMQHICDLTGSHHHVALGTDMDGGLGRDQIPLEIQTIADLPRIADALASAHFSDEAIRAIMGENWLRFFSTNLADAHP